MRLCALCGGKIAYMDYAGLVKAGYLMFFDYQQNTHHYFCPEHTAEEIIAYLTKIVRQEKGVLPCPSAA